MGEGNSRASEGWTCVLVKVTCIVTASRTHRVMILSAWYLLAADPPGAIRKKFRKPY